MEHTLYWLWLTLKQHITPTKITCLLEYYETIEDIYNAEEYSNIRAVNSREQAELTDKSLEKAKEVWKRTQEMNIKILVFDDKDYPDMLRNIIDPPYLLYVKGNILPWDRLFTIGVVGTRKCGDYGKIVTANICRDLVRSGVTVVSGMARGIDGIAGRCAIKNGGRTIAVLGSGLDVIYPPENEDLYEQAQENGAVITEYPPGTQALPTNFPARNRIIAGLSRGVLVTEADSRSGSLITARLAFENNRDVFAVPGNILDSRYEGTNRIIQSYAKLVTCAKDITDEYPYEASAVKAVPAGEFKEKVSDALHISVNDKKYSMLKDKEKAVIKLLIEKNMHVDELIRETGIPAGELNTITVLLEMNGFIKKIPGNNYKLKI